MKFLCSLLAVIILVLSFVPCSDAGSTAMQHTTRTGADHPHSSGQEHKDLCSPFCQCSCCAIALAFPVAIVAEAMISTVVSDQVFASYQQQWSAGIASPVWQPPRLV